jgi:light-regulated signal transduction histidine kinase (bacteriophytochrome)
LQAELAVRERAEEQIRALNAALEDRVVQRTAQLEAAVKELDAFSYSISHDLRAPIRAMDGFSGILLQRYAAQLPAEPQRYLQLVRDNAQRMGQLVDDLLAFSRLSRQPLVTQRVAPAELARQVLAELAAECEGRCIHVSIGELPSCQAAPALLKQVLANLLANALKFTSGREVAVVEVGCRTEDGQDVYFVKDNGAGFDMRYASKLFGVFRRLHTAEEYPGTGVGLAIVQRIVERHGGRVWAEAAVDQGATFYFTLGGDGSHE